MAKRIDTKEQKGGGIATVSDPIPEGVYFAALEHGVSLHKPISCNQMIQYLKDADKGWHDGMQEAFSFWFFLNFYEEGGTLAANRRLHGSGGTNYMRHDASMDSPAVLMGDAYMRYIDILELREARRASRIAEQHASQSNQNAKEASIQSRNAFRISAATLGASILVSGFQFFQQRDDTALWRDLRNEVHTGFQSAAENSGYVQAALLDIRTALDTLAVRKAPIVQQPIAPAPAKP